MQRALLVLAVSFSLSLAAAATVNVSVTSPTNGSQVNSPFTLNANASSNYPITGWQVYVDGNSVYSAGRTIQSAPISMPLTEIISSCPAPGTAAAPTAASWRKSPSTAEEEVGAAAACQPLLPGRPGSTTSKTWVAGTGATVPTARAAAVMAATGWRKTRARHRAMATAPNSSTPVCGTRSLVAEAGSQ